MSEMMSLEDVVSGGGQRPHRRSRRAAEKRRKRRRARSFVIILISLAVVAGAVGVAWIGFRPVIASLTAPNDYTGAGTGSVTVIIPDGASGTAIANVLAQKGVVKTSKAFVDAFNNDPRSAQIQPGTYQLRSHMSAAAALDAMLGNARTVIKVTIPEGKRLTQIVALLAQATHLSQASFTTALKDSQGIGLPAEARGNPEGYLFPATYEFQPSDTPTTILRTMIQREQQAMTDLNISAAQQRAILIEASLVQAEAGRPADMGKIARVLQNRIAHHMNLGLDTTIHYATGKFTVGTTTKDTQFPSPYNTYLHPGLPPGPICSPGEAALQAVMNPTPGPWLYFVAVNPSTGDTRFAITEKQFLQLKAQYDAWQRAHPGQ